MDYAATYPQLFICLYASNMILLVDSDTAYLVMFNAKSRIVGYFQLNHYSQQVLHSIINGTILVKYKALKHVVLSAVEVEIAGIFHNA